MPGLCQDTAEYAMNKKKGLSKRNRTGSVGERKGCTAMVYFFSRLSILSPDCEGICISYCTPIFAANIRAKKN
jgi:hypothetical protein